MMKWLLGVAAAALSAGVVSAQAAPPFRLCTGGEAGNYFKAGHILKAKASNVAVDVVPTQGSIDNLDRIVRGDCDGAFVQSDAMLVYSGRNARAISSLERAGVIYQEHAHLLCNKAAGISRIVDLTAKNTVAVGPDGTGARTTWDAFVIADKKRYAPVHIDTRAGVRALSAAADGSQVQCVLWVGALNSSFMRDDAQRNGDRLVLAGTDDADMGKVARDARGQPVYSYGEIPAGTYPQIQPGGLLFGTMALGTITVDALFVASTAWIDGHDRAYDGLLRAMAATKPDMAALAQPR